MVQFLFLLSDLIKEIILDTSHLIKKGVLITSFDEWQEGYEGFTYSNKQKDILIKYVQKQESHPEVLTFIGELFKLFKEQGFQRAYSII